MEFSVTNKPRSSATADRERCWWCGEDPLYVHYHDTEWGVPLHDDHKLFEMLILEGAQAGLSWITVLRKRQNYRKAFHNFDAERIARYGARDIARLMANPGIIRNKLKIAAAITNAQAYLRVREEFSSFDSYIWQFTNYRTLRDPRGRTPKSIPASSPESDAMSKDLKHRGFKFVGSTICYAHMQATGMVDDHVRGCFKFRG